AARLAELPPGQPFAVAALGRGGSDAAGFLDGVRQDLEDIAAFCAPPGRRQGHWWAVGVYETRLPAGADGRLLAAMARLIEADGPPEVTVFCEATLGPDWRAGIAGVDRKSTRLNSSH